MFIYLENGNLNNEKKGAPFSIECIDQWVGKKDISTARDTPLVQICYSYSFRHGVYTKQTDFFSLFLLFLLSLSVPLGQNIRKFISYRRPCRRLYANRLYRETLCIGIWKVVAIDLVWWPILTTCCFFEADRLKQSGTLFKRKKKTFNEITYVLIDMFHQLLLLGTKKKTQKNDNELYMKLVVFLTWLFFYSIR